MRQDKAIVTYDAHVMGEAQRVNSQFSKVRIRVCYEGLNRHGEFISKETLTRMAENSLRNVPIVGHYLPDVNNFGGHDMALELEGNELRLKTLTQAYGVVPESTEFAWEVVTEKNGMTQHEYLVCDGILWTGRYPDECNCILDNGMNQSMELCVNRWGETADGYDEVLDGEFAALCILGKDSDPAINVEPCYEKAGIESYSLNDAVAELVEAYKASLVQNDVLAESEDIVESDAEAADVEESNDEMDERGDEAEEVEDSVSDEEPEVNDEQVDCAVAEDCVDASAAEIVEECVGETVEDGAVDYHALYDEAVATCADLRAENEQLTSQLSIANAELEELRAYRSNIEAQQIEAEMRSEFADLDGDEDFESFVASGVSVANRDAMFEKCYALRGKKNKPQNKNYQYQSVKVPLVRTAESKKLYGGLVDEYRARHNK